VGEHERWIVWMKQAPRCETKHDSRTYQAEQDDEEQPAHQASIESFRGSRCTPFVGVL
jgi:hypothetical protein